MSQNFDARRRESRKVVALVQSRMNSSRLPGKALLPINSRPCLAHVISRLEHASLLDSVVIATGDHQSCDGIEALAKDLEIPSYRGSEEDLLDRLYQAAKIHDADVVLRITGDCPLVDPQIVDKVVHQFLEEDFDFVSNNFYPSYPYGLDVQAFSFRALESAWKNVQDTELRALGPFAIYYRAESISAANIACETNCSHIRLVLDYPEDLLLLNRVFEELSPENKHLISLDDLLLLFSSKPDLLDLNKMRTIVPRTADMNSFDEILPKNLVQLSAI